MHPPASLPEQPQEPSALRPETLQHTPQGQPYSARYGDVYASRGGAAGQARAVFLQGCGLLERPAAWCDLRQFVVLEAGFGLGTNFLATWQAWRDDPQRPRRLHYVGIELHPLSAQDLLRECADPRLAELARQLAAQWPAALPGLHPVSLDSGRVQLLLAFGDIGELLPRLRLGADAVYLDGFAPARNPRMWSRDALRGLTGLCRPGARLATYSVARPVRDALGAAGWEWRKLPGYAGKAQRLQAWLPAPCASSRARPARGAPGSALVIGAGLAGAACAQALAGRGWQVRVLDEHGAAGATSALPAGLAHLRPAALDERLARLSRSGLDWLRLALPPHCGAALLCGDAVLMAAQQPRLAALHRHAQDWDARWLRLLEPAQAAAASGLADAPRAWWTAGSVVAAGALCRAWLRAEGIELHAGSRVHALRRDRAGGLWQAFDEQGALLAQAQVCVLACAAGGPQLLRASGLDAPGIPPLHLQAGRGFVVAADSLGALRGLRAGVMSGCYALPLPAAAVAAAGLDPERRWLFAGATYEHAGHPAWSQQQAWEHIGAGLRPWLGAELGSAGGWPEHPPCQALSFRGERAGAADRLPLVGDWPAGRDDTQRDLYLSLGMGSRGLLWSALAAQCIASEIEGEPAPLEDDLLQAVHPLRAALRRRAAPASGATPRPAPAPASRGIAPRDGGR